MNEIFCDVGSKCAKRCVSFCHKDEINVKDKQLDGAVAASNTTGARFFSFEVFFHMPDHDTHKVI